MSCRHGYYGASPKTDYHAILYNDEAGEARLVLLDGQDEVAATAELGAEKVRGLQFDPSAAHLVALISGGTNIHGSPSYFVKMRMPSLEVVWRKPVFSEVVGLEKWTPDNSDSMAVSEDRYVLHSAGQCVGDTWCEGHQGDLLRVLDAATGEPVPGEAADWASSHSCKQMVAYNQKSDSFLIANAGDYYPKALQFTGYTAKRHLGVKLRFESWGNGGGKQGVTQGAISADSAGTGFGAVWSYGLEAGEPDKLYFAVINTSTVPKNVTWRGAPKKVFPASTTSQLGSNIAPLGGGRWLVAYTESATDVVTDYLKIYFDNWGLPQDVRDSGSRLAVLSPDGEVIGEPVDISALGAPFPVEVNHLLDRPAGVGWMALGGAGSDTAKVMQLRCQRDA